MLDKDKPTDNKANESTTDKKVLVIDNSANTVEKSSTSVNKSSEKSENLSTKKTANTNSTSPQKKSPSSDSNSKSTPPAHKQKVSKLAVFSLVIALLAIGASAGHYLWQQQQSSEQIAVQSTQTAKALQAHKQQLENSLNTSFSQQLQAQLQKQQQHFTNQLQQYAQQANTQAITEVSQLTNKVVTLEQSIKQRNPNDWLTHEAEYLLRVSARTMWLEQDTQAAIGLLREADSRLEELKQPKYLPIRALIHQDIEALALMPTLDTENAILSLMALNKQVGSLPLAKVNLTDAENSFSTEDLALSSDISDWQSNLSKTWHKFFNDFIVVRRRAGSIEPLMAPDQQQNLKENLRLKIQLAQWSASEHKNDIYQQTLLDIQEWLKQFFDMEATANENFYQAVEQAKKHIIHYNYPSHLASLDALKQLLNQSTVKPENTPTEDVTTENEPKNVASDEGEL